MAVSTEICSDPAVWDAFVAGAPHASVFSTRAWLDAVDRDYALVITRRGTDIVAGAPIILDQGRGGTEMIPFMQYCGLVLGPALMARPLHSRVSQLLETTSALLTFAAETFGSLGFTLEPEFPDMRSFQWLNYHTPEQGMFSISLRYTGLIELPQSAADFDMYIETIRTVRRQEYRRALRQGYVVEDSDDIEMLQALHEKTFARQGLQRSEREVRLLASISRQALREGIGTISIVRRPGEPPVGATLFLHDARKCYYLIGANDPDHRSTGASVLLFLEHMRRYAERGIRVLDVVGINSPQRGDYKTSFNAAPAAYYRAELRCGAG